jgi:hypothetical protein
MLAVRNPADIGHVQDPDIRALISERIPILTDGEPYDPDTHGYFIIMEPGDTADALAARMRFPVLENRFLPKAFGDPGFAPCAEVIEEHPRFFDVVYVIGDAGFGINLFVLKQPGVPAEILAMYAQFAIPAPLEERR